MKEVPSECIVVDSGSPVCFTDVACGYAHTIAVSDGGKIFVCGLNKHGQLGTGDNITKYAPFSIQTNFLASTAYASENSSSCISRDGVLYTWGSGAEYRLMHGDCSTLLSPKAVAGLSSEVVSGFVFSTTSSAVLIKTRLFKVYFLFCKTCEVVDFSLFVIDFSGISNIQVICKLRNNWLWVLAVH